MKVKGIACILLNEVSDTKHCRSFFEPTSNAVLYSKVK